MTATPISSCRRGWLSSCLRPVRTCCGQIIQIFAEALISADADAVCGAAYGQRSLDRRNVRNGYRWRGCDTRTAASSW